MELQKLEENGKDRRCARVSDSTTRWMSKEARYEVKFGYVVVVVSKEKKKSVRGYNKVEDGEEMEVLYREMRDEK